MGVLMTMIESLMCPLWLETLGSDIARLFGVQQCHGCRRSLSDFPKYVGALLFLSSFRLSIPMHQVI